MTRPLLFLLGLLRTFDLCLSVEVSPAAEIAERAYLTHRARFQNGQSNVESGWQFARACFDWADFAANAKQREEVARQGIDAAHTVITLHPDSAEAHFYLALNLGQLARTKTLGALKLVREIERELKHAAELNEKFDCAGARRSLGMLYRDAPGWPASIGSKSKARVQFERAVELFPDFPDNRLAFAEALAEWNEKKAMESQLAALKSILPMARERFSGDKWAASWLDWNARLEKLERRAEQKSSARGRGQP